MNQTDCEKVGYSVKKKDIVGVVVFYHVRKEIAKVECNSFCAGHDKFSLQKIGYHFDSMGKYKCRCMEGVGKRHAPCYGKVSYTSVATFRVQTIYGRKINMDGGYVYVGDVNDDTKQPDGKGMMVDRKGAKHIGAFKTGMPDGYGESYDEFGGLKEKGLWHEGKCESCERTGGAQN